MSLAYSASLCRLIAPEKLSDRFLVSGMFQQHPELTLTNQVLLLYIFEVHKPWFPSSKVLSTLTETLQAQHATLTLEKDLGDQFELVLKAVNEQLNKVSESGETDWIGNLDGLIMILGGEELHFAQTGNCPAYILQNNRIRQITEDLPADSEPHPLRTFSNLASGVLQAGDHILFSNHELYREISLDALRRILNSNSPYQACTTIAKELKRIKNPAASSFIIKISPDSEPASTEPREVLLEEEMQGRGKKLQKRLMPLVARLTHFGKKAASATQQVAQKTQATVAPKAAALIQKGVESATQLAQKATPAKPEVATTPKAVVEIIPSHHVREAHKAAQTPPAEPSPEPVAKQMVVEIIPAKADRERNIHQQIAAQAEARIHNTYSETLVIPETELDLDSTSPIGLMSTEPIKKTKGFSVKKIREWLKRGKNKRITALVIGSLILVATTVITISRRTPVETVKNISENARAIKDAQDLDKKITSALALNQKIEATKEIEQATTLLNSVQNPTDAQKKQLDDLWVNILTATDTLTGTTRFEQVAGKYTYSEAPTSLISKLPFFYSYLPSTNKLLRTGKGEQTATQATLSVPGENDSIISLANSSETDVAGYAFTKQKKIYQIQENANTSSLKQVTAASEFATGDTITNYNGNLYILDGKSGLLWRYASGGNGSFAKGVSIIDSTKYDIKKAISLTIDGSIYLLKNDGSILKFTSGTQNPFQLKDVPSLATKMLQPLQIRTDESSESLYILDGGTTTSDHSTAKVLQISKNGTFVRQYAFPKEFTKVKGFDVNEKEKKMWILNDNEVSEFNLL